MACFLTCPCRWQCLDYCDTGVAAKLTVTVVLKSLMNWMGRLVYRMEMMSFNSIRLSFAHVLDDHDQWSLNSLELVLLLTQWFTRKEWMRSRSQKHNMTVVLDSWLLYLEVHAFAGTLSWVELCSPLKERATCRCLFLLFRRKTNAQMSQSFRRNMSYSALFTPFQQVLFWHDNHKSLEAKHFVTKERPREEYHILFIDKW